jgi:hypothetical protein
MPLEPPVIAFQWSWRENDGEFKPFDPGIQYIFYFM